MQYKKAWPRIAWHRGRAGYVLSHGVKEVLVECFTDWPGVHCVEALTQGKVLEGWWFDRTQEYLARRRGEDFGLCRCRVPPEASGRLDLGKTWPPGPSPGFREGWEALSNP